MCTEDTYERLEIKQLTHHRNSYDDCIGEVLRASTSLNIHLCISNSFKRYSKIANIYALFDKRKNHHVYIDKT